MKEYNIIMDGVEVKDTAIQIVHLLLQDSYLYSGSDISEFIQEIQYNTWKLLKVSIIIDKSLSIENQCESLVEQLIENSLLPE